MKSSEKRSSSHLWEENQEGTVSRKDPNRTGLVDGICREGGGGAHIDLKYNVPIKYTSNEKQNVLANGRYRSLGRGEGVEDVWPIRNVARRFEKEQTVEIEL